MHGIDSLSIHAGLSQGLGEMPGRPETGEFDFLNYLLGLPGGGIFPGTDPAALMNGLPAATTDGKMAEGDWLQGSQTASQVPGTGPLAQDPLAALFSTDKSALGELKPTALAGVTPGQPEMEAAGDEAFLEVEEGTTLRISSLPAESEQDVRTLSPAELKVATQIGRQEVAKGESESLPSADAALALRRYQSRAAEAPAGAATEEVTAKEGMKPVGTDKELKPLYASTEGSATLAGSAQISGPHVPESPVNPATITKSVEGGMELQADNVAELTSRVESLARDGGGKMTVSLNPPELGEVEIDVTTRGRNVEVQIRSGNDLTRSLLESGLGDLKSAIHSQDLNVAKLEVQLARPQEEAFLSQNSFAGFMGGEQSRGREQGNGRFEEPGMMPGAADRFRSSPDKAASIQVANRGPGRVDLRI